MPERTYRIKPLEWRQKEPNWWIADTPWGSYEAWLARNQTFTVSSPLWYKDNLPNLQEAKKVCDEHWIQCLVFALAEVGGA